MPAIPTMGFGSGGREAAMNKALERNLKLREKEKEVLEDLEKTHEKMTVEQRVAFLKTKKIMKEVTQELRGTIKNANRYGKAIQKDTKLIAQFAEKHKVGLNEAVSHYKKVRAEQQEFWSKHKDNIKTAVLGFVTVNKLSAGYRQRLGEVHEGHRLFLASAALTGKVGEKAWKDTSTYVDAYRSAMHRANRVAAEHGATAEEAAQVMKSLMYTLRGSGLAAKDLDKVVRINTDALYSFSRMAGVQVTDAMDLFRDSVYRMGKAPKEAMRDLDRMIAGFDNLSEATGGSAGIYKDDYIAALKTARQEISPLVVNTKGLEAAMTAMGIAARKSGRSGHQVAEAMKAIPRMMSGLPDFFKVKIGKSFHAGATSAEDFMKRFKGVGQETANEVMRISKLRIADFEKEKMMYEAMMGTRAGVSAMLEELSTKSGNVQLSMLRQMGLSAEQVRSVMIALGEKELTPEKLAEITKTTEKGIREAKEKRQDLPNALAKHSSTMDKMILSLSKAEAAVKDLIHSNELLIGGVGALTTAVHLSGVLSGFGGLAGMKGARAAAGAAGAAGEVTKRGGLFARMGARMKAFTSKLPTFSKSVAGAGKGLTGPAGLFARLGLGVKGLLGRLPDLGRGLLSASRNLVGFGGKLASVAGRGLVGFAGKLTGLLGPAIGGAAKGIVGFGGKLLTLAGPAGALAAAATAGYALGTALDRATGASDKLSDWFVDEEKKRAKERVRGQEVAIFYSDAMKMVKRYKELAKTKGWTAVEDGERRAITKGFIEERIRKMYKGRSREDLRVALESARSAARELPAYRRTVTPATLTPAGTPPPTAPGAGVTKPAQMTYDPSTRNLTIFNMDNPAWQQAMGYTNEQLAKATPSR